MTTPNDNNTESTSSQTENSDHMIPKTRFDDVNNKLKDALKRLEAMETSAQQREAESNAARQQELAEQNRYKELYEQTLSQLESLKSVQQEAARYKESFQTSLNARLEAVPEDRKHLIPDFEDPIKLSAWLDKAMSDLTTPAKPIAPKLDGGSGASLGQRSGTNLTADEIAFATAAGIPLDAYAASKAQRGQPINLNKKQE